MLINNIKQISNAWLGNDNVGRHYGFISLTDALIELVNTALNDPLDSKERMVGYLRQRDEDGKLEPMNECEGIRVEKINNGFLIYFKPDLKNEFTIFSYEDHFIDILGEYLNITIKVE